MADIYTVGSPGTALLPNKCVIGLYNNAGSNKVVRVYKIWALNNQTAAVTGGIFTSIYINRLRELSGGIALNYLKHNSQSPNLPAQIQAATNPTIANAPNNFIIRRSYWQTTEPSAAAAARSNELFTIPKMGLLYDCSYFETNIEPITLRADEGIGLIMQNLANGSTTPVADFFIEFTVASS